MKAASTQTFVYGFRTKGFNVSYRKLLKRELESVQSQYFSGSD